MRDPPDPFASQVRVVDCDRTVEEGDHDLRPTARALHQGRQTDEVQGLHGVRHYGNSPLGAIGAKEDWNVEAISDHRR
jgi:hypothetical protein